MKSTSNWSCTSSVWICLNVHRCEKCWRWHFVKCPSYDPSFGMARPGIDLPWHHGPCFAVPLTQVLWQQEGRLCQLRLQCWSSWPTCSSLESEMQPHNRVFDLSAQKLYQVFISWGMWVCLQIGCPKIHWFRSSFSTLNGHNLGKDVPHFGTKADEAITINPLQPVLVGSRTFLEMISKREWSLLGTDSFLGLHLETLMFWCYYSDYIIRQKTIFCSVEWERLLVRPCCALPLFVVSLPHDGWSIPPFFTRWLRWNEAYRRQTGPRNTSNGAVTMRRSSALGRSGEELVIRIAGINNTLCGSSWCHVLVYIYNYIYTYMYIHIYVYIYM